MSKKKSVSTEAAVTSAKVRKQAVSQSKTKLAQLEAMLRRPDGATVEQISKSLDWQTHSVRGAMSGALKKKQGLTITSEKTDNGRRLYRIAVSRAPKLACQSTLGLTRYGEQLSEISDEILAARTGERSSYGWLAVQPVAREPFSAGNSL